MKINFKLDERKISKSSRSKIYDLGQVTTTVQNLLDNSEITITDNLIPVIKITSIDDEVSYYLLPDLNYEWGNISGRNTYSFTVNNLIALGGSGSSGDTKKYKFLLSQSGGDDPQTATSGSLTQGVTYEIVDFVAGDDFTLSGAPNNDVGTKWIANGVSPTWSNGSEIGWNNGAPFIYAQISDYLNYPFWFVFNLNANYAAEKTAGFDITKTWYIINEQSDDSADTIGKTKMKMNGDAIYFISTDSTGVEANNILDKTPVEITIKP